MLNPLMHAPLILCKGRSVTKAQSTWIPRDVGSWGKEGIAWVSRADASKSEADCTNSCLSEPISSARTSQATALYQVKSLQDLILSTQVNH